jgi:tetratricopeptide (TPR) repeat protein
MRKAGIHNELGEWSQVVVATEQALEKGLDDPADAHILAGMAYTELRQFDRAISTFRKARDSGDDKQRRNANSWLEFVQEKIAVQSAARN